MQKVLIRIAVVVTLLGVLASIPLLAAELPKLTSRVNDYAGMISARTALEIEKKLEAFETATTTQVMFISIQTLGGEDLEGYSIRLAESWKIGQKGKDNGVIFLAIKQDRKLRIEVGYGLEGVLPDAIASRIVREIITPKFKTGDFDGGINAGLDAIMAAVKGEYTAEPKEDVKIPTWIIVLVLVIIVLFVIAVLIAEADGSGLPWSSGGVFSGGGGVFSGGGGGFGGGGASGSW